MDGSSHVPPGFRFHPTDEELVDYYLRKKVTSNKMDLDVIKDVDLYKIEPWDLREQCKIGVEEQNEWYFFSHKDKKYPTGTRTNRATTAGFWKATGRDKPIYTKKCLVGMRKTLVFYRGRAPSGHKSDWIMHEYRLETTENASAPEEGWVVCRVFKKRVATVQRMADSSPCWFDDHVAGFMPALGSPRHLVHHHHPNAAFVGQQQQLYHCKPGLEYHHLLPSQEACFLPQLPQLESPKPLAYIGHGSSGGLQSSDEPASRYTAQKQTMETAAYMAAVDDSATDWGILDKFVASQLFTASKEPSYSNPVPAFQMAESYKREETLDYASTSASGDQAELWK